MTIARFMFEKFGTKPSEVLDMDDYDLGVMFAFMEDIANVHKEQIRDLERRAAVSRYRRR